jgi:hypothetical protein
VLIKLKFSSCTLDFDSNYTLSASFDANFELTITKSDIFVVIIASSAAVNASVVVL